MALKADRPKLSVYTSIWATIQIPGRGRTRFYGCAIHLNVVAYLTCYSRFRVFKSDCTLHSVITHMMKVWEQQRLTSIPIAQSCVGVHRSNTKITWVIAKCNVQSGLKTLKRLYYIQHSLRIVVCEPLSRTSMRFVAGVATYISTTHCALNTVSSSYMPVVAVTPL